MAKLTFRISAELPITDADCQVIHAVGSDRLVRCAAVARSGDRLVIELQENDGVKVKVPYRSVRRNATLISTCSLRVDNKTPYDLLLEMARGALFRFRNLVNACRDADLRVPELTTVLLEKATLQFSLAAVKKETPEEADTLALESLVLAQRGMEQLEQIYAGASQQAAKRQHGGERPFLRGFSLAAPYTPEVEPLFSQVLNSVVVEPNWKACETEVGRFQWDGIVETLTDSRRRGLTTILGPMICLDRLATPDWLYLWENEFHEILNAAKNYCQQLVNRFRDDVDLWYCAAGLNDQTAVSLKEEQRLQLLLHVIQSMRSAGLRAPLLVSFAKPWGEYLASRDRELAPIHFAEELVRARVGITGIGLELNFGPEEPATYYRGFFDVEELLDYWSLLGVPLFVTLSAPSSWRPDAEALYDSNRQAEPAERLSRRTQRELVQHVLPALLTHPQVQGVFWSQATDLQPHRFPHAGLIDPRGRPKSAAVTLTDLIRTYFPENTQNS